MINLLIVDDEVQVADSIKEALPWDELGIHKVLTANSMKQAIRVLGENEISIMLCDIEMPKGNGIELLRWVRENKRDIENIFLTCHADFSYAKEAIALGSMDYLLKPVPFSDLRQILEKAVRKVNEKKLAVMNQEYSQYWRQNKKRLEEQFLSDLITGNILGNEMTIKMELVQRKLVNEIHTSYQMIYFHIKKYGSRIEQWEKDIKLFTFRNIAEEIMGEITKELSIFFPNEEGLLVLMSLQPHNDITNSTLQLSAEDYIDQTSQLLGSEVYAYIGKLVELKDIKKDYDELMKLVQNNVALKKSILFINQKPSDNLDYPGPKLQLWKVLLRDLAYVQIEKEINQFFATLFNQKNIGVNSLERFTIDFLQLIYSALEEKEVLREQVLKEESIRKYYVNAVKSIEDCRVLTLEIVKNYCEFFIESEGKISRVERAKRYILSHLEEEISREDVAGFVYLHPDYLTKLFKDETGMTITDYIYEERMNLAKSLLLTTNQTIKDIAVRVGYSNFSHFSKMFARYFGMTPKEFRKYGIKNEKSR